MAEGDLSDRVRRRATELDHDADLRLNPPSSKSITVTPEPDSAPSPIHVAAPIDRSQ